ncbi:DHA1 family bicyclomycin/chloramphenicol resistance-like MFS transporter [Branchiibius hedensis]|uniref:MFS transporter, DHA1 family, bicyclomycin/chloramphenicol resistance protein n=2 Tax=Branchiibius hedensis TaxID=672460 RepID=A0A2Y8ZZG2_9MICO|nr:DHA1 family bicyclomycin/chloramphenicol resistance-like MFS transporter [Branchiibius hedensis]SSA35639.1 MFS transporter, DHA1 family, bicyclomycin/chloramphenicol resistance protein [Branchiibius hedensis]
MLVLAVLTALSPLSMDIYAPSMPQMQQDLNAPAWLIQASITGCLLGIAVGQLFWGPVSDRHGRRPVIVIGMVGWTLASGVSIFAVSGWMLVATRGVAGLCGAAGIVAARSVVRDLTHDAHAVAGRIGVLSIATALAPILSPVAGTFIAGWWGWRADFVAMVVLGVVIVVAFIALVPESLPADRRLQHATPVGSALVTAGRNRELAAIAASLGVLCIGFYAYIASVSFVVEQQFGYSPSVFALVFGTNALAILAGNTVFRRLVRTRRPTGPMGAGLLLGLLAAMALWLGAAVDAPAPLLWAASTVYCASMGLVFPGAHSWGQLTLVASGAASALTGAAQFFGGAIGSPVTGLVGISALHLGIVAAVASAVALSIWRVAQGAAQTPTPAT